MTRELLIAWVQTRMDELQPTGMSAEVDSAVIGQELDKSVPLLIQSAPRHIAYLSAEPVAPECLVEMRDNAPFSVVVPLYDTFLRFFRVWLNNWKVPVDAIVEPLSQAYLDQFNPFTKATIYRPVAAIVPFKWTWVDSQADTKPFTNFALQLFPAPTTAELADYFKVIEDDATYEKSFDAAAELGLELFVNSHPTWSDELKMIRNLTISQVFVAESIHESLTDALVWMATSRMFSIMRNPQMAQVAMANYNASLIEIKVGFVGEEAGGKR